MRPPLRIFVLVFLSSLFLVLAGSRASTVRSAPAGAPPDAPRMSRVTTGDRVAFALTGPHTARPARTALAGSAIVLHDLLPAETLALSTHPDLKWSPAISGDLVVWDDGRSGVGNHDIFAYDYALGFERQVTTEAHNQTEPQIDGTRVVYTDDRSGNQDIYLYDLATGVESPICTNPARQFSPAIGGDIVAWMDQRNGTHVDVYMYDLATRMESPVAVRAPYTGPSLGGAGWISIDDGRIVWSDWSDGDKDVYLYDVAAATLTQITTNPMSQGFPDIDGDLIVWEDNRNSPEPFDPDTEVTDIYMYDLATGTESAVSTDPERLERLPAVSGERVVWGRGRDIVMRDLAAGTTSVVAAGVGLIAEPDFHGHRIVWEGTSPVDPYVRLLFVPMVWDLTQAAFEATVREQVGFFLDAIPLSECTDRLAVTALDVATQNLAGFTCTYVAGGDSDCGVGHIAGLVDALGIDTSDYDVVVGVVDTTPCWPIRGCSNYPTIWVDRERPITTAHELGHVYGLEDEYCSNPAGSVDCRCNDGDQGDTPTADCDDAGGDGAATGDLNWLDNGLGCDPDGACCTGCVATDYGVCCDGNQNAAGGRCVMSYANAPDPRDFCTHCRDHLATVPELTCGSPAPRTTDRVIDVQLVVGADDTVRDARIVLRRGRATHDHERGGDYRLEVTDGQSKVMWRQDFNLYFDYYGVVDKGVDYSGVEFLTQTVGRKIPYDAAMREVRLFHGARQLFSRVLSFCDRNGVCDGTETSLTCPSDCPGDRPDRLCRPIDDGVCDPDCATGVDPDCATAGANLFVDPASVLVAAGSVYTVTIQVADIDDLYGAQLALSFDPAVVEVVDADPATPGVQVAPGDFLAPDVELRNTVSNTRGTIEYTASLRGEKPGVGGSGILAEIVVRGRTSGRSPLAFTTSVLSDPGSRAIPVTRRDGEIVVTDAAQVPYRVSGRVLLERRTSNADAIVCAGGHCATTAAAGAFTLSPVNQGQDLKVTHPSYLRSERTLPAPPAGGGTLTLPDVTLLGGDVDHSDRIHLNDGALVGMAMTVAPSGDAWYTVRDVTADGVVDILDMVAVQFNWDERAPGPWPGVDLAPTAQESRGSPWRLILDAVAGPLGLAEPAQAGAVVRLDPEAARAEGLGQPVRLDIRVDDVADLYAFAVKLSFDPAALRVRDANARTGGVQVIAGEFLDYENWVILRNEADNAAGKVELAITQTGTTPGRSGSGLLGAVEFVGLRSGTSTVSVSEHEFLASAYPDTSPIASQARPATVTVGGDRFLIYAPRVVRGME